MAKIEKRVRSEIARIKDGTYDKLMNLEAKKNKNGNSSRHNSSMNRTKDNSKPTDAEESFEE